MQNASPHDQDAEAAHAALAGDNARLFDAERRARAEAEALAIENARLYQAQAEARSRAEQAAAQTARLQAVTARLSEAVTPEDVAEVVIHEAREAVGGVAAALTVLNDAGDELSLIAALGFAPEDVAKARRIPLSFPFAAADAVRRGQAIFFQDAASYLAAYPSLGAPATSDAYGAAAAIPLITPRGTLGALSIRFAVTRGFDAEDRSLLCTMAAICAQALERSRFYREAQQAIRVRDEFLGIAGHELKTPLTAIQLGVQSLLKQASSVEGEPGKMVKRLAACQRQVDRLGKLIHDLLDVSRITAGRLLLDLEPVDLAEIVDEGAACMGEELARAGCALSIEAESRVVGRWDRARLEQVVINLLSNAVRYGKGRPIEITVARTARGARLAVRDHGIGIAPQDQERIFDRFERASSTRNYGGLGLGLWIVRQIVEAHGGRVGVQSAPGEGATFYVELPDEPEVRSDEQRVFAHRG